MATRTVKNTGGNFSAAGTWVEGVVPTAADAVVFTASSGQLTVDVSSVCLSIDFTNFVNTITFNNPITVSGNVTLAAGFTQAGGNGIIINANSTITSNGVTWSRTFGIVGTVTITLSGDFTITGSLSTGAGVNTFNGSNFTCYGITLNYNSTNAITGSSTIIVRGGSISGSGGVPTISCNLTIDSGANTVTFGLAWGFSTGTFTYTSGTVAMGSSMLFYIGSGTYNTGSSIVFKTQGFLSATTTVTLNSDLYWTDTLTLGDQTLTVNGIGRFTAGSSASLSVGNSTGCTISNSQFASTLNLINLTTTTTGATTNTINGITLNVSGNAVPGSNGGNLAGTSSLNIIGTGTLGGTTATIKIPVTINTSGTITIGSNLYIGTGGSLTYTSGTVVTTGSTLVCATSTTLNTNGITWNSVNLGTTTVQTFTLSSNLTASGTLTLTGAAALQPAFAGAGKLIPTGTLAISSVGTYDTTMFQSTINLSGSINLNTLGGTTLTLNGVTFNVSGSLLLPNNGNIVGTSVINLVGTGVWNNSGANMRMGLNVTINTSGTITIFSNVYFAGAVLTYTAGTVVTTGSTVISNVASVTTTFNTSGVTWNSISLIPSTLSTYVMSSDVTFTGSLQIGSLSTSAFSVSGTGKFVPSGASANFTIIAITGDYSYLFNSGALALKNLTLSDGTAGSASQTLTFNGITFNVSGNLAWGFAVITGTAIINMIGTGSCNGPSNSYPANGLRLNLTFNTSGTITIGTWFVYNTGTVTYTAGTVNVNSTFLIGTSVTINTGPSVQWTNVTLSSSLLTLITVTINSLLYVVGTLTNSLSTSAVTPVFAGTSGFSTGTLTLASKAITFKSGNTYTVRSNFTYLGGLNQDTTYQFNSSTPGSQAYLTVNWGATCSVACLTFADIDASGGRPIRVFTPIAISGSGVNACTLTNTKNIFKMTDLLTVGT